MTMNRIQITEHLVFDGHQGWQSPEGKMYRLACSPLLTEAPNGDLLMSWLSGSGGEPAEDNSVLLVRSSDRGKTWSEPSVWFPAGDMAVAIGVMEPTSDGKIVALGANWPADKHYVEWYWFRIESIDNGVTWSEPQPLTLRETHNAAVLTGIRLQDGRHMLPCQYFEERPNRLVGPPAKLALARTEEEAHAIPAEEGLHGFKFATHLHGCSVMISEDEQISRVTESGRVQNRPFGLLEPSIVQLKSGKIVMFMRADWGGYLWRADSEDGGQTWTDAWQTDIPNPSSLVHVLRLPDGRIALIHNNNGGVVGERNPRDPLSIWISEDELETWSVQEDVIVGGQLAYPNGLVTKDGKFVFAYDRDRRKIQFVEVEL